MFDLPIARRQMLDALEKMDSALEMLDICEDPLAAAQLSLAIDTLRSSLLQENGVMGEHAITTIPADVTL